MWDIESNKLDQRKGTETQTSEPLAANSMSTVNILETG